MAFRVRYLRRSRELYRRYLESKPWVKQLYASFFGIKTNQKIVDVGCGTGDFTRYLAEISGGRARFLGIDSNEKSIKAAIVDTDKAGFARVISYRPGDVYKIPLEDNYADLTCCRTLLMHLPDPLRAVREMARITRAGGSVIAAEGGKMASFYDPDDREYSKQAERAYSAWVDGINKLEGKEFKIGEKLPGIFRGAGLSNIKAEIQADAWLYSDPRRKLTDIRADLRFEHSVFNERRRKDRKYLIAGGLSPRWVSSYFDRLEARTKTKLSAKDEELRNDASFYGATFVLVSGTKS
jgi:ubiquinone/menaquinone biosynthesis C-methylase UbiE